MDRNQMDAYRQIARAWVQARIDGDDFWIPAHEDTGVCILDELHAHGLIDGDGRVTPAGARAFAFATT